MFAEFPTCMIVGNVASVCPTVIIVVESFYFIGTLLFILLETNHDFILLVVRQFAKIILRIPSDINSSETANSLELNYFSC